MALPKQVQKQIADANRIEGEIRAAQALEAAAAQPVADAETPPPDNVETPTAAAEAPAPEPAPVPAPAPQPDAQYETLLQQYRSLQGIHRTMSRNNSELQSQVQTLQASIQEVKAELERVRQQATPAPADADVGEFDPALISIIDRKAREATAPLNEALAKVTARNAELEQSLASINRDRAESAATAFEDQLSRLVPDINALNYDQNFLAWLSQVDPLDAHKQTLQQRLDEAVRLGDARTAAGFFNTYKSLATAHAAPAPAPAPKPNLAAQAQPTTRSAPDASSVGNVGRKWAQAEIAAFYDNVTRGKYTPQEKARIEKEIFSAQRDNRIAVEA